jgi:hypothetical protein
MIQTKEDTILEDIDSLLSSVSDSINRTRKGRVWDIWIDSRPITVCMKEESIIALSAGCNDQKDYSILRYLARSFTEKFGGFATPPEK